MCVLWKSIGSEGVVASFVHYYGLFCVVTESSMDKTSRKTNRAYVGPLLFLIYMWVLSPFFIITIVLMASVFKKASRYSIRLCTTRSLLTATEIDRLFLVCFCFSTSPLIGLF